MVGLLKVQIIFSETASEIIYLNEIHGVNDLHKKLLDRYSILREKIFRMYWIGESLPNYSLCLYFESLLRSKILFHNFKLTFIIQ